jgi:GNAT superfamily N-acetyltransferase
MEGSDTDQIAAF